MLHLFAHQIEFQRTWEPAGFVGILVLNLLLERGEQLKSLL